MQAAMTSQVRSITLDQKVRPNAKSPSGVDHLGLHQWRRGRDSNPRWGLTHTRFPGVRLKPLIHLSEARYYNIAFGTYGVARRISLRMRCGRGPVGE